jgi:asparagine synthase (glutamine-hydrolysing)
MFAFALWGATKQELWLVRDRLGIKLLCCSVHSGRVTFASESKALLEDPSRKRALDEQALYHCLTFPATPAPLTMFEEIEKIPAGCWLRISENCRSSCSCVGTEWRWVSAWRLGPRSSTTT